MGRYLTFRVHGGRLGGVLVLTVLISLGLSGGATRGLAFWWGEKEVPGRYAMVFPQPDRRGDAFGEVMYLDQGWRQKDTLWFYNTTQGSDLLPYDFFLVLEQRLSRAPFRDAAHLNGYRYLPQNPSAGNPDGLPVGFVADTYRGKKYLGLTCAACHTGQINYHGTAIRIDGGPAGADMEAFIRDLAWALRTTSNDPEKRQRFVDAVLALGHYKSAQQVGEDLELYARRLTTYVVVNNPTTPYRYGRLDAFGRIYNRVLEHVLSADQLREVLREILPEEELEEVMQGAEGVLSAEDRDHIVARLQPYLNRRQQIRLRNALFNKPNAPVSYPFLWDTPRYDFVQWNGIIDNSGVGPIGRNAGEVIGVFATLDWAEKRGWTLSSALGGQGWFSKRHIDYSSSVDVRNLRRIERQLMKLKSPEWPEELFGAIDPVREERGDRLFGEFCESCHHEHDRAERKGRLVSIMNNLDTAGTDPKMAKNSVTYGGYSGILRGLKMKTDVTSIRIGDEAPVAVLLTTVDKNVIVTPDPDKGVFRRMYERVYDFVATLGYNEVRKGPKHGDFHPDTPEQPLASLLSYKGRSLNGIWATPPYLHNGSVPTLYDLLLPEKREGDPEDGEYRPETFRVGTREFDPVKVGFRTDRDGDVFDTRFVGNGNGGHEYGARETTLPDGTVLRALTPGERRDLLEYLKGL